MRMNKKKMMTTWVNKLFALSHPPACALTPKKTPLKFCKPNKSHIKTILFIQTNETAERERRFTLLKLVGYGP
jgi:hypothetical protein